MNTKIETKTEIEKKNAAKIDEKLVLIYLHE